MTAHRQEIDSADSAKVGEIEFRLRDKVRIVGLDCIIAYIDKRGMVLHTDPNANGIYTPFIVRRRFVASRQTFCKGLRFDIVKVADENAVAASDIFITLNPTKRRRPFVKPSMRNGN